MTATGAKTITPVGELASMPMGLRATRMAIKFNLVAPCKLLESHLFTITTSGCWSGRPLIECNDREQYKTADIEGFKISKKPLFYLFFTWSLETVTTNIGSEANAAVLRAALGSGNLSWWQASLELGCTIPDLEKALGFYKAIKPA